MSQMTLLKILYSTVHKKTRKIIRCSREYGKEKRRKNKRREEKSRENIDF